jgi:hypothetical protein
MGRGSRVMILVGWEIECDDDGKEMGRCVCSMDGVVIEDELAVKWF